jgi:hypothetical protein
MQKNFSENYLQFMQPPPSKKRKVYQQIIIPLRAQASPVSGRMLVPIYQAAKNHIPNSVLPQS